eukprot:jgi/Bigna1/53795/estExt_Genewise1Plus.C_240090
MLTNNSPLTRSSAKRRHSLVVACVLALGLVLGFVTLSQQPHFRSVGSSLTTRSNAMAPAMQPASINQRKTKVCAVVMGAGEGGRKIIISGAPASGKGTQCQLLVEKYGVKHISTGDALRAHVRNQSELGKQAKAFMDAGDLVPDELIMKIMREETLGDDSKNGWLLDGVPRTGEQVKSLEEAGLVPEAVILLEVPDEVLVERCVGRLFDPETGNTYHRKFFPPPSDIADRCITRSDDNEETMRNRISQFKKNRQSLIDG